MDFAKKQLEKYGWKDGEGLGKTNQGIAVAIKPALKTGKEGMGFDICQELTGTWWTKAYSDSLSRINVKGSANDGELLVSIQEDEEVSGTGPKCPYSEVQEERPMEKMRKRMMKANFTSFSKGGTLSNGEFVEEDTLPESTSNSGTATPTIKFLNDEELLKACGGRTAHKAARFGLKLNGKLARIAAQEQIHLSTPILSIDTQEEDGSDSIEMKPKKSKKKKRKHKDRLDSCADDTPLISDEVELDSLDCINEDVENNCHSKNKKRKKNKVAEIIEHLDLEDDFVAVEKPKKKKKSKDKRIKTIEDQES